MALFSKLGNILKQASTKQISNELQSSKLSIFQAIRCMSTMGGSKLFVGGVSYQTTDESLREAFSKYGEVCEARVIVDRDTGRSRGFGFVTYTSSEAASSAIQALDGQDLHGRRVRVNYATEKRSGFGGGGYGGGGYGGGGYGGGGYGGGYGEGGGGYGGAAGGYSGGSGGYGGGGYSGGGGGYGGGGDGLASGGNYGSNNAGDSFGGGNAAGGYGGGSGVGYGSGNYANTSQSGSAGLSGSDSFGSGGFDGNANANAGFGGSDQFDIDESAGVGDGNQDKPLEENFRDDDDDSDFAKRA